MSKRLFTKADLDNTKAAHYWRARDDFATFRRLKRPTMLWDWFPQDLAKELQTFHDDLMAGKRPMLAIEAPPQHGKSWAVWDFISWFSGKHPDLKTIFASFSDGLGVACNRDLERTLQSGAWGKMFPEVRAGLPGFAANTELIEFIKVEGDKLHPHGGSFRNTTIEGVVNGFGLHLGVIDDPHKSRDEADRKSSRDKVWRWCTDDFFPRFDQLSGLLLIQTRWHLDDVLGRLAEKFGDELKVLRYPAIAERESRYRGKGEALFPAHKSLEFLLERKKLMSQASFEAEYQQNPIVVGGGALPLDKLKTLPVMIARDQIVASVRYWDKAGTESDDAAFTVGCLMHKLKDGRYVIEHVARGHWGALEREQFIKTWAQRDSKLNKNYQVIVEQEPGSGGKESAENTIRNLAGFRVSADKVTGSKEVRAEPFAAQVQGDNVWLVAGEWVNAFRDECETWPRGKFKDQVDAAVGAFNHLVRATGYNTDYKQWAY
jgi:predicted phage terminase large subunit-like protein